MAIPNIQKCLPVRAPANIIRQQWANKVQRWYSNSEGQIAGGYTYDCFRRYTNSAEYNAGYAYICNAVDKYTAYSTINTTDESATPVDYWLNFPQFKFNRIAANDISDTSQIVGFLSAETVADFCQKHGYTTATRLFAGTNQVVSAGHMIFDGISGVPVNDLSRFDNWFVPTITWYYTGADGVRRSWDSNVTIYYFYSASGAIYAEYDSLLSTGNTPYKPVSQNYKQIRHFGFSPPYIPAKIEQYAGQLTVGAFLSGYIYTSFTSEGGAFGTNLNVVGEDNPYITLYPNPTNGMITTTNPFLYSAENLGYTILPNTYRITSALGSTSATPITFPAYKSIDDIINYFADFGVKLTTDLDEAIIPADPTTPEINPDNPSDPIPSYPDNTTDTTPIDPTYITPSTFGKSLVYNPLTTNRFLEWVSDSTVNIDNWRRLFANPADVIHGINIFNLDIVQHDSNRVLAQAKTNILGVETDIANYAILDGYNNIIDGGSLTLQAYYGNYADYTSMTYQMYIPFVGFTTLRACDVVNKTLHLYYAVDFMTGAAVAFLNSDDKLIYTSPCTVCGKIPLSTSDKNSQLLNNTMSALGGIGGLLAGIATGNIAGGVSSAIGGVTGMQLQTNYTNHGSMSGVNIFRLIPAFIERTRYDLFLPSGEQQYLGSKYQAWAGAPSTQFATLRECADNKGYCQSDYTVLPNCTATDAEKDKIRALIQGGVFIS